MNVYPDTSNVEAFQWGQLIPIVVDAVFDQHPDLVTLDAHLADLETFYGDIP